MKRYILLALSVCQSLVALAAEAPRKSTDANLFGHVVDRDTHEHIAYASVAVVGTAFGTRTGASAHYFVDRNGWLQSVSDEDTAWSVGTAGVYTQKHPRCRNGNSISIEMCCRYDAGRYWLENAVVANAALLTRRLMRKYGIPIENVLRHYDVVSKRCPAMWVDDENAWFAFKRQVMEVMEMTKEELLSLKGTGDHPSDWALQAAQWAKENGIFTGDSAGNFGWQQPVTREAVAKLLYEYDQARNVDSGAADMVK